MFSSYLRWRHSKGYGVHSPFAFSIVENVINPGKYGYYGYREIDKLWKPGKFHSLRGESEKLKFILRLAVNLQTSHIADATGWPVSFLEAVAKGSGKPYFRFLSEEKARMPSNGLLVTDNENIPPYNIKEFLKAGWTVLSFNPSSAQRNILETGLTEGVTFSDRRIILALPRKQTAFVKYVCRLL